MHSRSVQLSLLLVVVIGISGCESLQVIADKEGYLVLQGNDKILYYQRKPKSLDGKYTRSHYIHPLYGLDGEVLTEDFPADHRHQRGLFWAWHQLQVGDQPVGDSWSLVDFSYDVRNVQIKTTGRDTLTLQSQVQWKSPHRTDQRGNPQPFVKEISTIRVHRARKGRRLIDFEIVLWALEDDVRIGGADNSRGYGGFSARLRLPEDMVFTAEYGEVTPQELAVNASAWMDFSGSFSALDPPSGVSIHCHQTTPHFPQPWILRSKESMQNPVFPGRKPVALSGGEPLRLRYRLVIHKGAAPQWDFDQWQREYDREKFPDE